MPPTMPQLGDIIPDDSIDIFPDGHYGAALLADDGSRRIVRGALLSIGERVLPYHTNHISHFLRLVFLGLQL